jgi:hypothetical protein
MLGGILQGMYCQLLTEGLAEGLVKQVVTGGESLPVVVLYLYMELCVAAHSLITVHAEAKEVVGRSSGSSTTQHADALMDSSTKCLIAGDVARSLVEGLDVDGDDRSVSALVLAMAHFASLEAVIMANRAAHNPPNPSTFSDILKISGRAGFVGETALQLLNRSQDEGHFERLLQLITLLLNMDQQGAIYQTDANILVEICLREIGEGHSPKVVSIFRPSACASLPELE